MIEDIMAKLTPEEQECLGELIWVDELTKLRNRRAFDTEVTKEITRSDNTNNDITLLLMDIDHFKNYNDTYGHTEGDRILREVGKTTKEVTKGYDTLYRYGGEEFAVLLPNTTTEQGTRVAERVRKAIEHNVGVTVSVGVSNYRGTAKNLKDFIDHSDTAMYEAKANGRNQVVVYE